METYSEVLILPMFINRQVIGKWLSSEFRFFKNKIWAQSLTNNIFQYDVNYSNIHHMFKGIFG